MSKLYSITEASEMCNTTPQMVLFYEEQGLIQGSSKMPRQYREEQIQSIKNVLLLRAVGMSISEIRQIQEESGDLSAEIIHKKDEICNVTIEKIRDVTQSDEICFHLKSNKNAAIHQEKVLVDNSIRLQNAERCTDAIISGDIEKCYPYFTAMFQAYVPLPEFQQAYTDIVRPLGAFIQKVKIEWNQEIVNVMYQYLQYEGQVLSITYVFRGNLINDLYLNQYSIKGEEVPIRSF